MKLGEHIRRLEEVPEPHIAEPVAPSEPFVIPEKVPESTPMPEEVPADPKKDDEENVPA